MARQQLTHAVLLARLLRAMPTHVRACISRLRQHGYQTWVVGGAVRDLGLGQKPNDWDLIVDGALEQWLNLFTSTCHVVVRHGVARVRLGASFVDISPLKDAKIPRGPTQARVRADLLQRDLTINAIAVDVDAKSCLDPCNGLRDLVTRVLRTPSSPRSILKADPIRVLRILRLVATLKMARIEKTTAVAMSEQAQHLAACGSERLQLEVMGLLQGANWGRAWLVGQQLGVWRAICPALADFRLAQARRLAARNRTILTQQQKLAALMALYAGDNQRIEVLASKLGMARKKQQELGRLLEAVQSGLQAQQSAVWLRLWCCRVGYETALSATKINGVLGSEGPLLLRRFHRAMRHAPRSLRELAIDGTHLQALGYHAQQIGVVLGFLWQETMLRPSRNRFLWLSRRASAQHATWGH